jgi:outer membrane lipoprotein-sorting protein
MAFTILSRAWYHRSFFLATIIFEKVDESGKLLQYEYTVSNDRDRLNVEITELENGKRVETYLFNFEIDPENKINDPTK